MRRTILEIDVRDVEKRKLPSKHYVYVIYVTWSDSSTNVIYRRYSRFFDFQSEIMDMFPEEAGTIDPEKRIIPFLPGKKFFGRSHVREVAVKRLGPIADYCKQLMKLPKKISECKEVLEFFELEPDDINPPKGKKASIKAKKISNPKPLEVFIAVTGYKKQEKGEISLQVGAIVEVVEKTETGWWFVNVEEEQGWVPSTCLEREDGTREESTVVFRPGEEEQYLCTEEFKGQSEDEISLDRGAVVDVIEKNLEGWWRVRYNGKEGYAPATYLMKCESFKIRKQKQKPHLENTLSVGGPQIIKSLQEVSNLLNEEADTQASTTKYDRDDHTDDEFDDTYEVPDEDKIYSINELSKILKEDKRGSEETEKIYESIHAMKSRSLKRHGSTRPPPRPSIQPKFNKEKSPLAKKPSLERLQSVNREYVTVCDFSNEVADGISFQAGQHVKVLEKNESGWWYIEFDDKEGWAPASYITSSSQGQTADKLTTPENNERPKSPLSKTTLSKSREDLSEADEKRPDSPKSQSNIAKVGDLASALKSKLKPKGPPTPPKKDFLEEETNTSSASSSVKSPSDNRDSRVGGDSVNKPVGGTKPVSRSMLVPPPPPPSAGKPSSKTEKEEMNKTRPLTPTKPKQSPPTRSKQLSSSTDISSSKTKEDEENPGKLNVSGLTGALKARFEGHGSENMKPNSAVTSPKSKQDNIPKPPIKPLPKKPDIPATANKTKDTGKVLNKPNIGQKPASPSNKPSWVKPDNSNSTSNQPSWVKPNNDNTASNKPSWVKPDNDNTTSNKPSWVKPDNDNTTSNKPSWVKPDNDNTTSNKPSWVKGSGDSKTGQKPEDSSAPKVNNLANVLKAKFENRSSNSSELNGESVAQNPKPVAKGIGKVENRDTSPGPQKPSLASAPKLPVKPVNNARPGPPQKYSSRPLPPKPSFIKAEDKDADTIHDSKPLPAIPGKLKGVNKGKITDTKSDSSDDDSRPAGVSGLANALKAKLGGKAGEANSSAPKSKPLPVKPIKPNTNDKTILDTKADISNNVIIDKVNDNAKDVVQKDNMYRAIAEHIAGNDSEINLSVGLEVELLEEAEGWWYVCSDTSEGWAPANYLEKVVSNGAGEFKTPAEIKTPRPKSSVFRTCSDFEGEHDGELSVSTGQEVTVVEKDDGGWWLVNVDGKEGWVPAAYLEEV